MNRRKKPSWQKSISKERIEYLFSEAGRVFKSSPGYAHRYVELARNIGMRYRTRISKELKRQQCRHCHKFLKPGVNCTIRLSQKRQSKIVITCKECGGITRVPYKK